MDTSPIIIAGGGIAGLASALALGSRETLILEQAPAFTNAGAGIQLGPNAVRALQKLGAWEAVEPYTSKPKEIQFRDGLSGKLIKRLPLGSVFSERYGADYHVAHRAGLHAGLLDVVRSRTNLEVRLDHRLEHVDVGHSDVQVRIKDRNHRTPALIATDGVESRLRQMLFPGTAALNSGTTFHRALLALPLKMSAQPEHVVVWMIPGGHVVHYGLRNSELLNIVAITPDGQTPLGFFKSAAASLRDLIAQAQQHFTVWPSLYAPKLSKWTAGHVLLLGDAAHGTLPYMAQGAAMALEDAACLNQSVSTAQSLKNAFAETAERRVARTHRLHNETIRTGKIYHAGGLLKLARNYGLAMSPEYFLHLKLDWLYKNA